MVSEVPGSSFLYGGPFYCQLRLEPERDFLIGTRPPASSLYSRVVRISALTYETADIFTLLLPMMS